ncbi:MAG: hypothetical protein HS127_07200 [Planctomycetia bacterium]|nr:hypothetical protein [Planctomycetia bacterium]
MRLLGKLGGHLGRRGDGHPGSEVLWRGMSRLADIELLTNFTPLSLQLNWPYNYGALEICG